MDRDSDLLAFLGGPGEMSATILKFPWYKHALGEPTTWPQSLTLALRLLLHSSSPMFLWWGPNLFQFYNDAYRRTMGMDGSSKALGKAAVERNEPAWTVIRPMVDDTMKGEGGLSGEDTVLPMFKAGWLQPIYWNYQFLPVDHAGVVGGVLAIIRDVSLEHPDNEHLRQESQNLLELFERSPGYVAVLRGAEHRYEFVNLEFRKLVDNRDVLGKPVLEALPEADAQGFIAILDKVFASGETFVGRDMPFWLTQADGVTKLVHLDFTYSALLDGFGNTYGTFIEGRYTDGRGARPKVSTTGLSGQEQRVLHFLAAGMTAQQVANAMRLSKRTVESYIQAAAQKLHTANSVHTVVEAIRRGDITL